MKNQSVIYNMACDTSVVMRQIILYLLSAYIWMAIEVQLRLSNFLQHWYLSDEVI